jgi:four helix bundle protein
MVERPNSYKGLLVLQKSLALVTQMRRPAVSVPSNIAEGQSRHTSGEFIHFISHAEGSLAELDTQVLIAIELGLSSSSRTQNARRLNSTPSFVSRSSWSRVLGEVSSGTDCRRAEDVEIPSSQLEGERTHPYPEPLCLTIFATPFVFC